MNHSTRGPMEGEQWKIDRTFPSGLFLSITRSQGILQDISFVATLGKKEPNFESIDHREYQYDMDKLKREKRHIAHFQTNTVAWHPSKPLLVTAGVSNVVKLWNTTDGRLLTKHVLCPSPSAKIEDIRWAPDGACFVAYEGRQTPIIYDGETGEMVFSLKDDQNKYRLVNGHLGFMFFDPWRPNSNQLTTIQEKGILSLWNRESGKLEQSIDCNVKEIFHFSWHPSGRFIAVCDLDNSTTSVIDVNNAKIIAVLRDRRLNGWLPDGKGVWMRSGDWSSHLVWDAQEMVEEPISKAVYQGGILQHREGLKTENAWDKEVFLRDIYRNVSADGLRYIEVSHRGEAKIFSTESLRVVSTLPQKIYSAAWSSHDGQLLATCVPFNHGESHIWRLQ